MTDIFVLLYLPNSGDDVQGIKRGILELADFVVITKADGALTSAANLAKSQIEQALMLTRGTSHYPPQVFTVSSITGEGIAELGEALLATAKDRQGSGFFANKRREQSLAWFRSEFIDQIVADADRKLADEAETIRTEVENSTVAPSVAARKLISKILKK
jgi:LAO/AO transport system kinase